MSKKWLFAQTKGLNVYILLFILLSEQRSHMSSTNMTAEICSGPIMEEEKIMEEGKMMEERKMEEKISTECR